VIPTERRQQRGILSRAERAVGYPFGIKKRASQGNRCEFLRSLRESREGIFVEQEGYRQMNEFLAA
jgi:hypothetical protein